MDCKRIEIAQLIELSTSIICILIVISSFSVKAQIIPSFYNPYFINQNILLSGYPLVPNFNSIQIPGSQGFSYQDYYADYPYLQRQNSSSFSNNSNNINSAGSYVVNTTNYIPGYSSQINTINTYNPYQTYQPVNYSSVTSNTYQTVPIYTENTPNNNNITAQTQTYQQTTQGYTQTYVPSSAAPSYLPATQNTYYRIPLTQVPNVYIPPVLYPLPTIPQPNGYIPQTQPNIYIPPNGYVANNGQNTGYYVPNTGYYVPNTGYYVPNANYWPNATVDELEPPVDIEGKYEGEWVSDTTGDSGHICAAEIDQADTEISGTVKLKNYVLSSSGKSSLTGTVNGTTVTIEINLSGLILEFVGIVQDNGDIVGTYTVEGSSDVLDEGTITLYPK